MMKLLEVKYKKMEKSLIISNIVLSSLVTLHLACEFFHYISSYLKNRRDKRMLEHIDGHLDKMEKCEECELEEK